MHLLNIEINPSWLCILPVLTQMCAKHHQLHIEMIHQMVCRLTSYLFCFSYGFGKMSGTVNYLLAWHKITWEIAILSVATMWLGGFMVISRPNVFSLISTTNIHTFTLQWKYMGIKKTKKLSVFIYDEALQYYHYMYLFKRRAQCREPWKLSCR